MAQLVEPSSHTSNRRHVQDIVARFTETWRAADPLIESIDLLAFLPSPKDPLRIAVLSELIAVDLDMRYARNQLIDLEHYLLKFPELGTPSTVSPDLIYEEYAARQRQVLHSFTGGVPPPLPEPVRALQEAHRGRCDTHGRLREKPAVYQRNRQFPPSKSAPQEVAPTPSKRDSERVDSGSTPPFSVPKHLERTVVRNDLIGVQPISGPEDFLERMGYHLFEKLGAGGVGEVRRAEAPGGVEVAVKIIRRPTGNQVMANRELEALELIKRLRHPYLLQTQAYWPLDDSLVIVMDLADETLSTVKSLPQDELLTIFSEAAEAIDFLHEKNIQHRDIKPSNILLLKGHAKVADFGLARMLKTDDQATMAGAGTPAYIAPEVLSGTFSKHSDQFSLALSYAELRRGAEGLSGSRAEHARLHERPDIRDADVVRVTARGTKSAAEGDEHDPRCTLPELRGIHVCAQGSAEADAGYRSTTFHPLAVCGGDGTDVDRVAADPVDQAGARLRVRCGPSRTDAGHRSGNAKSYPGTRGRLVAQGRREGGRCECSHHRREEVLRLHRENDSEWKKSSIPADRESESR